MCASRIYIIFACLLVVVLARPQIDRPQQQQQPLFFFPQRPGGDLLFSTPNRSSSTTTTDNPVNVVTTPSPQFLACMQSCPSTMEYNPVCGSDSQNYHNEWRLQCAQRCGKNVAMLRDGVCSPL